MTRDRVILALTLLLSVIIFFVNVYVLRGVILPGLPYFVPILLAAYFLPPRLAIAVALFNSVLRVTGDLIQDTPFWLSVLYLGALALVSYLSIKLSMNTRRSVAMAEERALLLGAIDAQRQLFQAVVQNAPAGIAVLRGPGFIFELVNPGYQAIAPGKMMVGRTVAEVWPELADHVLPLLERVLRTREPYYATDVPLPLQRAPEGPIETVYLTFSYVPLRAGEGLTDAILVLVIETTEQVLARQRIEELATVAQRRAAELKGILDNMVDAVLVGDVEGRITLTNEAGMRLLGLSSIEDARRPLLEFIDLLHARHLDGRPFVPGEMPLARALAGETVVLDDAIISTPRTRRDVYVLTT